MDGNHGMKSPIGPKSHCRKTPTNSEANLMAALPVKLSPNHNKVNNDGSRVSTANLNHSPRIKADPHTLFFFGFPGYRLRQTIGTKSQETNFSKLII
jgi:hypothetical protein